LSARSYCITAAAAALLAAAPLVAFLSANHYPLASPEAALLLVACAAAGALVGLAAFLGATAAALLLGAGAVLSLDLLFGLDGSKAAALLVFLVCLVLRRHVALVIAVALCVLVTATLVPRAALARSDLPVIVHLVLDEHIGIDGIPAELPESAAFRSWLTRTWVEAGFRVHAGAYSQYTDSRNSMANLLNFTSLESDWAHLAEGRTNPFVLSDSAYFRHLAGLGYRLRVYQSDYMDFCRVPGVPYAGCFAYRANSVGALAGIPLGVFERARLILNSFAATSSYLNRLRVLAGVHAVSRVGPLPVLPVLRRLEDDLRRATPGQAYFAHLLIPHYPYVLDEGCRVRDSIDDWLYNVIAHDVPVPNTAASRAERYRRYFAQIRCQQSLLARLFDAMKEARVWREALIVVHGDHGSRITRHMPLAENAAQLTPQDFSDAFSTLFAVRKAGAEAGVVRGPRALQELLAEALGLPAERPASRIYLRTADGRSLTPLLLDRSPAPQSPAGR
jgi:hypothetical protein